MIAQTTLESRSRGIGTGGPISRHREIGALAATAVSTWAGGPVSRSWRASAWILALLVALAASFVPRDLGGARLAAQDAGGSRLSARGLDADARAVLEALIRELRYWDTARRWLLELRAARGANKAVQAEVDSYLIDILQAEGKSAEALAALDKFKKDHPSHPRAALGALEQLAAVIGKVLGRLDQAATEPDPAKSAELLAATKKAFADEIETPLGALIADLDKQASEAKDSNGDPDLEKLRLAHQAELVRVNIYLIYARALPAADADRTAALEKGLALAENFVNQRFDFYIMQYKAQLQKGLYLLELDRHARAAEEFSYLHDIEPPLRGTYDPALVKAFHEIRLQAILFGARALNAGKNSAAAADLLRRLMRSGVDPRDPLLPVLDVVEKDVDLEKYAVLARLEFGISIAGSGEVAQGMAEIHHVIAKYGDLQRQTSDQATKERYEAFVVDARKALGQVSAGGRVMLSGRDYYQAALGLKSQRAFDTALESFQRALASLAPTQRDEYAPLCLNEIGEICYILGRYDESAVAFSDMASFYPSSEIFVSKANRSFAGAVNKAKAALGAAGQDHAGFLVLEKQAEANVRDDDAKYQAFLADGARLEESGRFDRAREKYDEIPEKSDKGQPVSFYPRAQANRWATFVREYDAAASQPATQAEIATSFERGVNALESILDSALTRNDKSAAAVAALTLGQMRYHREEFAQSVAALRHFLDELSEDKYYRCTGLGYLVLGAVKSGEGGGSARHYYISLRDACPNEPATAAAAYALSDDATRRNELNSAGVFMLHYAQHPSTADDLKSPPHLMKVIQVLIDGGLVSDAREYIEKAKQVGGGEAELGRELLWLEIKIAKSAENWAKVLELGNRYVSRYKVGGDHYEDPYVCIELGWATIKLDRVRQPRGTLPLKACFDANKFYGHALYLFDAFLRRGEKVEPQVRRDYWIAALRLMQVKSHIGRNDEKDGYNDIHKFVNENQERIRTQTDLWPYFEKLWLEALKALGRDPSEYLRPVKGAE